MRSPSSRTIPLLGALAAGFVLAACGSGGGDGSDDKAAAKDSPPSKADFTELKTALSELKADYQEVYDAGAAVQKTSVSYFKSHPKGTADDAALESVTDALDDAVEKRDDAIDEVEDLDGLEDPEVAKAYDAYSAKAEKGDRFHDSLFAGFPLLEQTFAACNDVFSSTRLDTSPSSPADFGRRTLAQYQVAIADCLPTLQELSGSDNANLAAFGTGFTKIVEQRRTLLTRLSTDDISMPAFNKQYAQVASQVNKVGENIDFQKQLDALSPVPEFLALEKVVAGKAA